MSEPYNVGTISVSNGGTTVTGVETYWIGAVFKNDMLMDPASGLQARVTEDPTSNTELTINPWPGSSLTDAAYEIIPAADTTTSAARTRDLLAQMSVVQANGRGLFYRFSDSIVDADPTSGYLRLNNLTIGSATAAYIDNLDANGATVSAILDSWDDEATAASRGQLWLRSVADPTAFHAFKVSGSVVDGTGYRKLTLTYIGGSGTFAADDELMVMFSAQGADGTNAILGVWQGAWLTATAYDVDDLVEQGGSTYICLEAHTSGAFSTDFAADKWELAVDKGDQGDQGEKGWSPQLVAETDGLRRVFKLLGYVGGAGAAPTANVGQYLKADGTFTATIGDAVDIRGPAGVNWIGTYSGATTYATHDGVLDNGSSWRALQATTGNAPPVLPTTSNAYWALVARAGTDGAGTGDVVGPASAVDGHIPLFDGTTGKLLKTSGLSVSDLIPAGYDNLLVTVSLLALQVADNTNVALFLGDAGNRVADSFDALTYVDVAGGTNVDTSAAGLLKPTSASGGIDANTLLMLHCDGADASTTFTDSSASARTVTRFGDAQIDTAQSKFGGASGLFDGTGDYLSVPDSADWAFGSGNFTIDLQARFSTFSTARIAAQAEDANNGWLFDADATHISFRVYVAGVLTISLSFAHGMSLNTWYHLALEKSGTTWRIYKDGSILGSTTDADIIGNYAGPLLIGSSGALTGSPFLTGWLDEIRISNVARWNGTFTAPSAAYTGPVTNNLTVASTAFTAATTPTAMKALIRVKEVDAAAAGTDYTLECSRDGGTTWAAMALTELFTSPSPTASIRVVEAAETDVSGQPSGTSPRWRFKTLNNKMVELHDVYFYWS